MDFVVHTKQVGPKGKTEMQCQNRVEIRIGGERLDPLRINFTPRLARRWNHIAVVWRRGRAQAPLNGESVAASEGFKPMVLRKSRLLLGKGAFVIDEIRLSSVARSLDQPGLRRVKLKPDRCTLLLIDFETKRAGQREVVPPVLWPAGWRKPTADLQCLCACHRKAWAGNSSRQEAFG